MLITNSSPLLLEAQRMEPASSEGCLSSTVALPQTECYRGREIGMLRDFFDALLALLSKGN